MKVLISPWGNFRSWSEVEYHFEGKRMKSKSPLPLLHDAIEPDKTMVILPDTLASDLERAEREVEEGAREFLRELGVEAEVIVIRELGSSPTESSWGIQRTPITISPTGFPGRFQ
ncbi:hypothetical protein A3L04_01025 [Thermococcus chitonophagus]|uniref:CRISPR system endoribonuclease Csx1 CARF domain-containing protein n=1 Tax=Thermococcus chitonophagus TaxID=54262 RepID=A0A2Z2N1L5_9EURY|nr:TM1812 family CRISPR-associated protein [Thermococcus chitonophagus]ASJ15751.1 hypothetical protein A3L04_01025 [Thermococcus chitonophagus]